MKHRQLNSILACVFLSICIVFIVNEVRNKPRVLILHSYDEDYSWVNEVSEGINRVFNGKPYSLRWHYMDTKRHPDEAFKRRSIRTAQHVIDQWQPNIVITIADNAQRVVVPYIHNQDMNIIFSGVFADPKTYGFDQSKNNVTGIQEKWPMGVIKKGIEQVFIQNQDQEQGQASDRVFHIQHIGDQSTTGKLIAAQIEQFDWGNNIKMKSTSISHLTAWKDAIEQANLNADLVIFSLYHTLYRDPVTQQNNPLKPNIVPASEVMKWTQENLSKPGLGGWGFYVEQGGMMAIGVSAYEQGEEAARLAVQILDENKIAAELPFKQSHQFLIYLRSSLLQKHHVQVPGIYEAFARANNNYYE